LSAANGRHLEVSKSDKAPFALTGTGLPGQTSLRLAPIQKPYRIPPREKPEIRVFRNVSIGARYLRGITTMSKAIKRAALYVRASTTTNRLRTRFASSGRSPSAAAGR
jgi:hypothetical protein